jgi:hypothetical protein
MTMTTTQKILIKEGTLSPSGGASVKVIGTAWLPVTRIQLGTRVTPPTCHESGLVDTSVEYVSYARIGMKKYVLTELKGFSETSAKGVEAGCLFSLKVDAADKVLFQPFVVGDFVRLTEDFRED